MKKRGVTMSGVALGSNLLPNSTNNGGSPDSTTNSPVTVPLSSPASSVHSHQGPQAGARGAPPPASSMYSLKWNTQLHSLQRSLANLWDTGIGTDAVLLCQGTPLPVHKIVLTAASPYCCAVVQTMAGAVHMMPVIVLDITPEAGRALLNFLYCGEAHVPVAVIPQLVQGAKFLGISGFGDPGVIESLTGMACGEHPSSEKSYSTTNTSRASPAPSPVPVDLSADSPHHQHSRETHPALSSLPPHLSLVQTPSTHKSSASSLSGRSDGGRFERAKSGSPYASPYQGGISPSSSPDKKFSPPLAAGGKFKGSKSSTNRLFQAGGILGDLLKNPRAHFEAAIAAAAASELANNDNNEMVQYEAEGYLDHGRGSPGSGYYYTSGGLYEAAGGRRDVGGEEDNEKDDASPIPAQLLEPNVEYTIGNETFATENFIQNPLADLAKVASAMQQAQVGNEGGGSVGSGRGVSKKRKVTNSDGLEISSSAGAKPKPKPKKPQESITCDICGKNFSNAYNLRVHMEGHSGQVFVCSVCSHASRSRDALRKHFAYRHRELWISGMSAFRKNVPGRKLSISKNNNNNNSINNNNNNNTKEDSKGEGSGGGGGGVTIDANGNIRGSDGTLTISEAKN